MESVTEENLIFRNYSHVPSKINGCFVWKTVRFVYPVYWLHLLSIFLF